MSSLSFAVLSKPLKAHVVLWSLAGCLWSGHALADDYADVNRLIKAGQNAEALNKVDQYLANKPRDPQMRFLKGVIQAETGKSSEAIATFVKLTEEFPELPEPYNNLAVLYASQSQFDKARAALEMAIRTNPSYATAHENLGDVYAKLASQAYSKALQLDSSNAGVPPKLALIRNLFAPDAKGVRPSSAAPSATQPPVTSAGAPTAASAPSVATKPAEPAAPAKTGPAQPATSSPEADEVIAAVKAWAKAWSAKDMDGYLAAYGTKFNPPGTRTRKDWEQDRKARIVSKGSISVDVSDFDVKVTDAKASAVFRQHYKAGSLVSNSRKTLEMGKENGRWVILRESTGG